MALDTPKLDAKTAPMPCVRLKVTGAGEDRGCDVYHARIMHGIHVDLVMLLNYGDPLFDCKKDKRSPHPIGGGLSCSHTHQYTSHPFKDPPGSIDLPSRREPRDTSGLH